MTRFLVPGIPFAVSLTLSLCTVGTTVSWQDSGFFLAGVRELGVLYPPGFVLYLMVCKAWTLLLGFLDFTLAVHLFSSVCAALAAAGIAMGARDLLRSEHDLAATAAGVLAAAGYSFWSAGLLAKSYALLYLILSLLIWRMIRADQTGKGRDFTVVAALIGLAWAAHPSATTMGAAFLLFVGAHRRTLGAKGVAWRTGVAAACAMGPSLLLPLLAMGHPDTMFVDPTSFGAWLRTLTGGAFTSRSGTFGVESWRAVHAMKYLWEDFLGLGAALALVGLSHVARTNRRVLLAIAAWTVPSAAVATLFRIEGQQDLWLVGAWLPLHLAVAVGLSRIPPRFARAGTVALAAGGFAWAVAANARPVSMRGDTLAEQFGRFHLDLLDRDSILLLKSDDALATTRYQQVVRGFRKDVLIVDAGRLGSGWYEEHLRRKDSRLKPGVMNIRAFVEANVAPRRPVYLETAPEELQGAAPVGPLLRVSAPGEANEPREWEFPVRMDEVRARFGRERGIRLIDPVRMVVEPEAYEERWVAAYVRAQVQQGHARFKRGGPENLQKAASLYESARKAAPDRPDAEAVHLEGACHYLLNDFARAEPLLKSSLRLELTPRQRMRSCSYLARICRSQGRLDEAMRWQDQAMIAVGADPELRREFDQFRPR